MRVLLARFVHTGRDEQQRIIAIVGPIAVLGDPALPPDASKNAEELQQLRRVALHAAANSLTPVSAGCYK